MVMKYRMHPFDLPLFDVVRMRIRQPEQSLAEMAHNRAFMQKLLIVEFLRQKFFPRGTAYYRALIGKSQFFSPYKFSRLFKQTRLADRFHIKQ